MKNVPDTPDYEIVTQIKDQELVKERRRQIVDCAVKLFIKHGYHKTSTRLLTKEIGISTGTLYEYITTKVDVLYLVCRAIYTDVENSMKNVRSDAVDGREVLKDIVREYFLVCNRLSDHILLLYQVTHFLPLQFQQKILEAEMEITKLFLDALGRLKAEGKLDLDDQTINFVGHTISVLGHTWAFRRWYFAKHFTIEEYIEKQTELILGFLTTETENA
jgi:AcrR family transcriptional regulator